MACSFLAQEHRLVAVMKRSRLPLPFKATGRKLARCKNPKTARPGSERHLGESVACRAPATSSLGAEKNEAVTRANPALESRPKKGGWRFCVATLFTILPSPVPNNLLGPL